jgi:adenosylhomocysteinase
MPLLASLMRRFADRRPFDGLRVAACLHVTAETAMLVRLLRVGGADVALAASNPLSTQDDIAAALADRYGIAVFARAGVDRQTYYRHIEQALTQGAEGAEGPDLVIDDGGDLVNTLHTRVPALLHKVRGGCESTTTGVIRLRRMAAEGALAFPVIAAHDTAAKRLVEGTCGTGQSVIDGILRATNTLLAGKTVVVAGFGASGRGVAERALGFGAQVIVTEIDPVRALDASLRGFRVLPMAQAAPLGEVFITATGSVDVITAAHIAVMRDGAILANAGHFDVEIDVRALESLAVAVHQDVRPHVDAYDLGDGRTVLLLAEGRVVNLVAAEGHPPEVMDLAFGVEALALAWLAETVRPGNTRGKLDVGVHEVPADIDAEAARLVLAAAGTSIDELTPAQRAYLASWRIGSLPRARGQLLLARGLGRDLDGRSREHWHRRRPGQQQPPDQPDRVHEVAPAGRGGQREHDREPDGQPPRGGAHIGRRPQDQPGREGQPGRHQQPDRDQVAGRAGVGQQMPGQRAGRRGLVLGQAEREQHGVLQQRVRVGQRRRGHHHRQHDRHRDREAQEPQGGPGGVPRAHHRGEHRDRGPGRRLHGAGHPQRDRGPEHTRRPGDQRQGEEHQGQDRRVGDPHRQRERDHR